MKRTISVRAPAYELADLVDRLGGRVVEIVAVSAGRSPGCTAVIDMTVDSWRAWYGDVDAPELDAE